MRYTRILLLALPIVLFFSCKKGDTGPQGPTGNANVMYSDWFTPSAYTKDTVFGIWGFKYNQTATSITQQVLDSGTVITYAKLLGYNTLIWPTNQVGQLPISLTYVQGTTMTDTWSAKASVGSLQIRFVNDKNYWTSIATSHTFRYIIIPANKKVSASVRQGALSGRSAQLDDVANNYQQMSYSDVCQKLGIPE
ncbi:MAG: hypothetical protein JST68_17635 [Bacteroidetes bacterium]|nr:hypothetical protein [Bacteroidota bacterium]